MPTTVMPSKGQRITGSNRVEMTKTIRSRYEGGESIRQIAETIGRSYGFVHRMVSESGADIRSRGGDNSRRKPA